MLKKTACFLYELFAWRSLEEIRDMPRCLRGARIGLSIALIPALALISVLASGCVTVEVEDHDPDCGDIIVVVEPDDETDPEPEPEPARLDLVSGGPPAGGELAVGAENADALCFSALASEEADGLIIDLMPSIAISRSSIPAPET